MVFNYLPNRKQRVKFNDSFSSLRELLFGVPQGLILGPLLFNVFICDLLYVLEDYKVGNYANDSMPLSLEKNHDLVVEKLEKSILSKLLKNNYIKNNDEKLIFYYLGKHRKHQKLMTIILNRNNIELDMIRRTY